MNKINFNFVADSFKNAVKNYSEATVRIGLWRSEEKLCLKYFKKSDQILDLGCGTGRTTFGLYNIGFKRIVGIDLSKEMIEEANRLKKKKRDAYLISAGKCCRPPV